MLPSRKNRPPFLILSLANHFPRWAEEGSGDYAKRMQQISIKYQSIALADRKKCRGHAALTEESKRLLKEIPKESYVVLLDREGITLKSEELAERMRHWLGQNQVVFVIGGPDGVDDTVKKLAKERISLSTLTLPHALAKVLWSEQLYRAETLLLNYPYHH